MEIRSFDSSTRNAGAIIKTSGRDVKYENKYNNEETLRGSSLYEDRNLNSRTQYQVTPKSNDLNRSSRNGIENDENDDDIDEIDVTYPTSSKRNSLRPQTPSTFLLGNNTNFLNKKINEVRTKLNNSTSESKNSQSTKYSNRKIPENINNNDSNNNSNNISEIVDSEENENNFAEIEIMSDSITHPNIRPEDYFQLNYFKLLKTNILDFIQTPPPKGYQIRCKLVINKGIFNEYLFYIETADNKDFLIMSTSRKKTSPSLCFAINTVNSNDPKNTIKFGRLTANLARSSYSLVGNLDESDNEIIEATSPRPKSAVKKENCIKYFNLDYNYKIIGYSKPKDLAVDLLLIDQIDQHNIDESSITTMFNRVSKNKVFVSKKPEFDPVSKKFKLDFKGRAKLPSSNNVQIIEDSKQNAIVFQLGKVLTKHYNCDFAYPMNAFQAFGIAISCISRN